MYFTYIKYSIAQTYTLKYGNTIKIKTEKSGQLFTLNKILENTVTECNQEKKKKDKLKFCYCKMIESEEPE